MTSFVTYPAALATALQRTVALTPDAAWQLSARRGAGQQKLLRIMGQHLPPSEEALIGVSSQHETLNKLLTAHDQARFQELGRTGHQLGVLIAITLRPTWAQRVVQTLIQLDEQSFCGFWIGSDANTGASVYKVKGEQQPLVCLHAATGERLWLMNDSATPANSFDLLRRTQELLKRHRSPHPTWRNGVITPTINICREGEIPEVHDMTRRCDGSRPVRITQTYQRLEVCIDQTGGEGATNNPAMQGAYRLGDGPILGWTTRGNRSAPTPQVIFLSYTDSWRPCA